MAEVIVRLYATVREAAGVAELRTEADDLASLFDGLSKRLGKRVENILESARTNREEIVILLNGKNVTRSDLHKVKLKDSDEVSVFPPVSGG